MKRLAEMFEVNFSHCLDELSLPKAADRVRLGSGAGSRWLSAAFAALRGRAGCCVSVAGRSGGSSLVSADFLCLLQVFGAGQDRGVPKLCIYPSGRRWVQFTFLALGIFLQEQWKHFRL